MDAAEYKHLVLSLIFVKYISDTFAARQAELRQRLTDPNDEYFYGDAAPEDIDAELEDRDYYREANVFWVPEAARWETIRAAAKQTTIGKHIDDALGLIEAENPKLKGILDKRYARAQLPDGKLPVQENRSIPCMCVNYGRFKRAMHHVLDKARNLFGNNGLTQVDDKYVVDLTGRGNLRHAPAALAFSNASTDMKACLHPCVRN